MKISFFEEFPNKKSLKKLELVKFKTTVYVAAKSIKEFEQIKKRVSKKNVTLGYWPVLEKKEGYWLSPFSSAKAVKRVIKEIDNYKNPLKIMWDAELPFRHPWLFLRVDYFLRNKPKIKSFFRRKGKEILTSEYPTRNKITEFLLKSLGVSFSPKKYKNKKIIMYYTSMHKLIRKIFLNNIKHLNRRYGKNLQVGLGVIATGILGNEPILSPKQLERDLEEMEWIGVKEVVIFRLVGLNEKYLKVLRKFL